MAIGSVPAASVVRVSWQLKSPKMSSEASGQVTMVPYSSRFSGWVGDH